MDATSTPAEPSVRVVLGSRDAAMARSRAYGLLGDLVAGPIDAELLEQVMMVPELAQAGRAADDEREINLDDLGAAHYELFGLQVFPLAGVFLNTDCLAGGDRVADMERRYRHWGFDSGSEEGAGHLACMLHFMAHLCALELGARGGEDMQRVADLADEAKSFLDSHLLSWSLPLLAAVGANAALSAKEVPLFSEVVTMAVYVASDHRRELGGQPEVVAPAIGPDPEEMMANSKTGVRDIAEFLLAPSRSGCWISRAEIQGLGREFNVPRGFGSRVQLLSNLLRNAAEYHLAEKLLAGLDALLEQREQRYLALSTELGSPAYAKHWLERLATTRALLKNMAFALAKVGEEDNP